MRKTILLCIVAACALAFAAADGAATGPATLVVDRDGVQCANADFTSIQAAVDAAQPGNLIRVCPDLYAETVVVDKPLTLKGDPDAVEAIDCFEPTLGELPVDQQAIVHPAGDGFSIAFKLEADDVVLEGFVVQGASVGIDASDRFSGYRIRHNLIRSSTLFAVDFGGEGTHESRVDRNCIRENRFGLVSELDNDADASNRGPENARDLRNARLDHNTTFRNGADCCGVGLEATGPGQRDHVMFDHNISRDEIIGISIQNATRSAIVANEITSSGGRAIFVGGGNDGLEIRSNIVRGAVTATGIRFSRAEFIDVFPRSRNVVVTENNVTGAAAGILVAIDNLVGSDGFLGSLISENTTSANGGNGLILLSGNTRNVIRGNHSDNNGISGVTAFQGATGNTFEYNSMHGNGYASTLGADARDFNPLLNGLLPNVWVDNDCDTDIPAGMICG